MALQLSAYYCYSDRVATGLGLRSRASGAEHVAEAPCQAEKFKEGDEHMAHRKGGERRVIPTCRAGTLQWCHWHSSLGQMWRLVFFYQPIKRLSSMPLSHFEVWS